MGIVPFDITRDQIRDFLLKNCLLLKERGKANAEITLALDAEWARKTIFYEVGKARLNGSGISIQYGIPTEAQMRRWNASIGKPIFPGETLLNDAPRLSRPDGATFKKAKKVVDLVLKYQAEMDTRDISKIWAAVSRASGIPLKEVERIDRFMSDYYRGNWDDEKYFSRKPMR